MAPAKKKQAQQTLSLGEFLTDDKYGSWAEEMDDVPVPSTGGRTGYGGRDTGDRYGNSFGYGASERPSDGYSRREELPLPDKPPYTAHVGNLAFEVTEGEVKDFFQDCAITSVRIVMDRMEGKPKGFGYVEFGTLDGLKKALDLSGSQFSGRNIRVSVAEPPKERPDDRSFGDWTRKGPLPDLPSSGRRVSDRGFGASRGQYEGSDAGSDRPSRRDDFGDGRVRDLGNWERKGPLPPMAPTGPSARGPRGPSNGDGLDERRNSPSWGEGRTHDETRPRREFQPRAEVERAPTAAELDNEWRKPKPESDNSRQPSSRDRSIPTSPTIPNVRPKLNLQKRTETAPDTTASGTGDSKASPFGAARPIDTTQREREIEEKRELAIREKKEQDEKAAAERKAQEEKPKPERKATMERRPSERPGDDKAPKQKIEILRKQPDEEGTTEAEATEKKAGPRDRPARPKKSESEWRRSEKKPATPAAPSSDATSPAPAQGPDEDGFITVSKSQKRGKGGAQPRNA